MVDYVISCNENIIVIYAICCCWKKQEFLALERITGEELSKSLEEFYLTSNIDIQEIRAQCYDSVSNMFSKMG